MSLQQFINYSSSFPTLALVPLAVSTRESLLWEAMTPCVGLSLQPQGQTFGLCPPLSYGSTRVVGFSDCSAFYSLLGWSGNFQEPYMWDQKLKVQK